MTVQDASPLAQSPSPGWRSPGRTRREHKSILAAPEKRLLVWMAERAPRWLNSDHLTLLGLAGMVMAGAGYWLAGGNLLWLHGVNLCLAVNWLGDSLDGTLARVRHCQRPRYGYYVDHVVDTIGVLFLVGGMAASGLMSAAVAAGILLAYYILAIDIYLATHALGLFRLSMGWFGPTELRILIAIGNLFVLRHPQVKLFGGRFLFLDVAGLVTAGLLVSVALFSMIRNTRILHRLERLP